jgi:hypothetical protein
MGREKADLWSVGLISSDLVPECEACRSVGKLIAIGQASPIRTRSRSLDRSNFIDAYYTGRKLALCDELDDNGAMAAGLDRKRGTCEGDSVSQW